MTTASPAKKPIIETGERQVRTLVVKELRTVKEGETRKIVGYAAVFNSNSEDLGGWVERIAPGAFAKVLREKQDVRCLFNHDSNKVLGRTSSGTLKLEEDTKGLRFECTPPDTNEARDVITLIDRGDVNQCSFSFRTAYPGGVEWIYPDYPEPAIRTVKEVETLYDVGPVSFPAYNETEVGLRSIDEALANRPPKQNDASTAARIRLAEAEVENG